jgi:DNA-binding LacI/PurR family transcriptional regulator
LRQGERATYRAEVPTNQGSPTVEDVARRADVSRATAARALAGYGPIRPDTRERVISAAAELGYVVNRAARALAAGRGTRLVVAAVTSQGELSVDAYLARVVAAAAEVCASEGLGVGLQAVPLDDPTPLVTLARDRDVVGVVLTNAHHGLLRTMDPALAGRVVSIGAGSDRVPVVDVDTADLAGRMTRHLVESGRRRIAMIAGPVQVSCTRRQVGGHVAAMRLAGLRPRVMRAGFTTASGRLAAESLLHLWPDTDAVIVSCDDTALGVLDTFAGHGIDVPEDVAVTGFDDLPLASYAGLTSATHPVGAIAAAAVRALLDGGGDHWFRSELVLRRTG